MSDIFDNWKDFKQKQFNSYIDTIFMRDEMNIKKEIMYHTSIKTKPIGGRTKGFSAICKFGLIDNVSRMIAYEQYGSSEELAVQKVINFLSDNGNLELVEVVNPNLHNV